MADNYRTFSVSPITQTQADNFMTVWRNFDKSGADIATIIYDAQTRILSIHVGGADLSAFRTRFRNRVQTFLGRFPDVDVVINAGDKCKTAADIRAGN